MEFRIKEILLRYSLIVAIILLSPLLYTLLLPITLYLAFLTLKLFLPVTLNIHSILFGEKTVEIIQACVGTSAFILLLVLNLATASISTKKRAKLFLFGAILFLIFNWLRIFSLSMLYFTGSSAFNQIHLLTWYFGSTVAVAIIWIISTRSFKIKEIPFLSDIFYLKEAIRN